ncbi:helix-turn-helix domain-containing protein [Eubacteriales bacterium OttesenSCG-928-K08]|nr:helix-turn-helix domain-containing protein [Eubacteriales bacterium OttesenSCG-928-K08]
MSKGKYHYWRTKDGLLKLSAWARDGLVEEQIAKNMGIASSTLYDWKNRFPEIGEALKKTKDIVDIEVENALHKSAVGWTYDEITREPLYNAITGEPVIGKNGKPVIAITKIVTKQVLPSNTAQIFWLTNRKPEEWKHVKKHEISGEVQVDDARTRLAEKLTKMRERGSST